MKALGHILLWIGFLSAAFWSVSQLEETPEQATADSDRSELWRTIPWTHYLVSLGVGFAGVVLLRTQARRRLAYGERSSADFATIQKKIGELVGVVSELRDRGDLRPEEVINTIDSKCVERFADFADARQSLITRQGLQFYADVMSHFAYGERYVNRAWSAAADGYMSEVRESLARARTHLEQARQLVEAGSENTSGAAAN